MLFLRYILLNSSLITLRAKRSYWFTLISPATSWELKAFLPGSLLRNYPPPVEILDPLLLEPQRSLCRNFILDTPPLPHGQGLLLFVVSFFISLKYIVDTALLDDIDRGSFFYPDKTFMMLTRYHANFVDIATPKMST